MTRLAFATLLVAALVAPQASARQQSQPPQTPVFRSTADVVPLFVTVTDKDNRLVTNLTREDFQVFDGGKAQPLSLFDNTPQPVRLIILIDISGSMFQNTPLIRRASIELMRNLAPVDLARIGTFGHDITFSPAFTRDAESLVAFLPTEIRRDVPTPLWSAVDQAISEFATAPPGRRVILVLSDSKDSGYRGKWLTPNQVSDRAQREDVMIYGVGLRSAFMGGSIQDAVTGSFPDPNLGNVAIDTGGGYFELRPRDDMAATFARVAEELRRQYLLGFAPPAKDGKTHKIEVKLRPGDMKPRVRKTYVAPK